MSYAVGKNDRHKPATIYYIMQTHLKNKETAYIMKNLKEIFLKWSKRTNGRQLTRSSVTLSLVSIMQAQVKNKQASGLCNPQEKHKTKKIAVVHLAFAFMYMSHINFTFTQVLFTYCN
jgi:hypothetical protein